MLNDQKLGSGNGKAGLGPIVVHWGTLYRGVSQHTFIHTENDFNRSRLLLSPACSAVKGLSSLCPHCKGSFASESNQIVFVTWAEYNRSVDLTVKCLLHQQCSFKKIPLKKKVKRIK